MSVPEVPLHHATTVCRPGDWLMLWIDGKCRVVKCHVFKVVANNNRSIAFAYSHRALALRKKAEVEGNVQVPVSDFKTFHRLERIERQLVLTR